LNAPLTILVLGILLAAAAFFLRGRGGTAWLIAAGGAALLGAVALGVVLGEPFELLGLGVKLEAQWIVLGRSLVLGPSSRRLVGFVLTSGALLLAAGWIAGAPRRMAPVGLLVLLALAAAMMVDPALFAPSFVAAAAILGCLLLVHPGAASGRGPSRIMLTYTFGMMAILLAAWFIEVGGATSAAEGPARTAGATLGLGAAILLGTPPFHTWLAATSDEAHPAVFVFLGVLLPCAGLFLLMTSLAGLAWLRADPLAYSFLRGMGLLMVGFGSVWCVAERRAAHLASYLLLIDLGVSLLAMSAGSPEGLRVALGMSGVRVLGAAAWAAGAGNLFAAAPRAGEGRPVRWSAAAAALAGAMSLAGTPLTIGFPGRWMTIAILRETSPLAAAAVALSMAAAVWSVFRWGRTLAGMPRQLPPSLPRARRAALWAAAVLVVALGVFPGWLYAWAVRSFAGAAGA